MKLPLGPIALSLALASCSEEAKPRADQEICPIDQPLTLNFRIRDTQIDIEDGTWSILVDPPSNQGCYVGSVHYVGKNFPDQCRPGANAIVQGSAYCSLCNGEARYIIFRATQIECLKS